MFLNRWLFRHEVIEQNQLNSDEEKAVFAVLKSFQGEGGAERFLESEADAVIGQVRRGRPPLIEKMSPYPEAQMDTTAIVEELLDRFFDRLAPVIDRFVPPEVASKQRMLTSEEAAKAMRIHPQTAVRWCREGRLEGTKVGQNWLVPREAVDAYLRRQKVVYGRDVK